MPDKRHEASARPVQRRIGFVGLGRMGTAMAANLAAAGREVVAYVRHQDRMDTLASIGLKPTTDITALFDCEIVISMLPDDDSVLDAASGRTDPGVEGFAVGLRRGAIHLSMSTIGTGTAARLATEHARHGQGYVAAPVFGNPDAAKARQLFIVMAGALVDVERCRPIVEDLGQQTFIVGANPAHANLIKLLGNMMTATTVELLGMHGEKIVAQSYAAGSALPLALKDVRLALAEAEAARAPLHSVGVVRDRLLTGIARGYAALDWTALGLVAAEEAGV